MYPELFSIGDFVISSFGLMLVLSFVASYFQLRWGLVRLDAGDEEDAAAIVFAAGFAGILGAKIYYAILYGDWRLLFDRSGLVWYGGFLLAAAVVLWTIRRRRLPFPELTDAAALALAVGYAVGRIGCFLVGDDYGRPTDVPWAIAFPEGSPPSTAGALREFGVDLPASMPDMQVLAVHPTQLYETGAALAIWGFGLWLLGRGLPRGAVGLTVIGLLAVERFAVELFRAKDDRFLGPFTLAQAISIAIALVTAILLARLLSRARARPPGRPARGT